jgi:hypothetical protein
MDTMALSSGVKQQNREANYSPPSSAEVCLDYDVCFQGIVLNCIIKYKDNFTSQEINKNFENK